MCYYHHLSWQNLQPGHVSYTDVNRQLEGCNRLFTEIQQHSYIQLAVLQILPSGSSKFIQSITPPQKYVVTSLIRHPLGSIPFLHSSNIQIQKWYSKLIMSWTRLSNTGYYFINQLSHHGQGFISDSCHSNYSWFMLLYTESNKPVCCTDKKLLAWNQAKI
jgi:hypothetical protein